MKLPLILIATALLFFLAYEHNRSSGTYGCGYAVGTPDTCDLYTEEFVPGTPDDDVGDDYSYDGDDAYSYDQ